MLVQPAAPDYHLSRAHAARLALAFPMNIRQLETLYWIAKLGTFNAAAERLHTTVPPDALSRGRRTRLQSFVCLGPRTGYVDTGRGIRRSER